MDTEDTNRRHFDEAAHAWEGDPRHVDLGRAVGHAICDALNFQGSERVFEFGAGTGLLSVIVAPRVASLTVMDVAPGMLSVLRKKCEALGLANVTIREGAVSNAVPDGMFDVVYSSMTLHHIDRVAELFRRLAAHVRPGGRVAFADIDSGDGSFSNAAAGVVHHGFRRDEFGRWLEQAGFAGVRFRDVSSIVHTNDAGAVHTHTVFLCVATRGGPGR